MESLLASRRSLADRPPSGRPVVLEVGCGDGEAALAYAVHRPDVDVVAVDVHTPGVAQLVAAAHCAGVVNLFVERADALELLDGPLSTTPLAAVHLFFPDPWPKTKHHKRRFVRADVLDLLAERLVPGGSLLLATDVEQYAAWALRQLDEHPAFDGGVAERPAWRPVTRYEAVARRAGRNITELHHRRH